MTLLARIVGVAAFCGVTTYLTAAAFVPSMGTGGWDFLFIGFAVLGLALGASRAACLWIRRRKAG